jgi:hypothetical protein
MDPLISHKLSGWPKSQALIQPDAFVVFRLSAQRHFHTALLVRIGDDLLNGGTRIALAALRFSDHQEAPPQSQFPGLIKAQVE